MRPNSWREDGPVGQCDSDNRAMTNFYCVLERAVLPRYKC